VPTNYVTFSDIQHWKVSEKEALDWKSETSKQTADTIITPLRTNVGLTVQKKKISVCSYVRKLKAADKRHQIKRVIVKFDIHKQH